jgi:hypothetical protein
MHGALRSLIISCVFSALALAGSSSLQAQDGDLVELSAQVQEQPAPAVPEQAKERIQEQLATQSESAPEESSPSQPAEPREQQASHATPEQPAPAVPEQAKEQIQEQLATQS